jgi:hypothetical protein
MEAEDGHDNGKAHSRPVDAFVGRCGRIPEY